MKKKIILTLISIFALVSMAYSQNKISITIDGRSMSATLADNAATRTLIEKLSEGSIVISMSNYGGFEKVGALPWSLPTSDTRITTRPGDIMLYMGNNIVIFYGQNTWAYTPLGQLETTDADEIRDFVGNGDRQVTISLVGSNHVDDVVTESKPGGKVFTLDGHEAVRRPLLPGIYIIDNKKTIVK